MNTATAERHRLTRDLCAKFANVPSRPDPGRAVLSEPELAAFSFIKKVAVGAVSR